MDFLREATWSPYLVGFLIGLLNVITLVFSDKLLGASTSYVKTSGMITKIFNKEKVEKNEYYASKTPKIDWGWMLVLGIVIGAFISSRLSGTFELILVPNMWATEISNSIFLRVVFALLGGIFMGVGARWAGGCTSGHGISGSSQLSILSWLAAISFFIGGIIAAGLVFGF